MTPNLAGFLAASGALAVIAHLDSRRFRGFVFLVLDRFRLKAREYFANRFANCFPSHAARGGGGQGRGEAGESRRMYG